MDNLRHAQAALAREIDNSPFFYLLVAVMLSVLVIGDYMITGISRTIGAKHDVVLDMLFRVILSVIVIAVLLLYDSPMNKY